MRRLALVVCAVVDGGAMLAGHAGLAQSMIQPPDAREPIEIFAHVDILPDDAAQAKNAVSRYVAAAQAEPGALRIDAMQELRQNHFDIVEVWRDEKAYRAHESSPATLRFRRAIGPWLGSPLNERVGTPVLR